MTRPTGLGDPKYGGTGEYGVLTTGAPAWNGDLAALDVEELRHRIDSLGSHIGSLHTGWDFGWDTDGEQVMVWRAATEAELVAAELPRWVAARVAALQEQERRANAAKRSGS